MDGILRSGKLQAVGQAVGPWMQFFGQKALDITPFTIKVMVIGASTYFVVYWHLQSTVQVEETEKKESKEILKYTPEKILHRAFLPFAFDHLTTSHLKYVSLIPMAYFLGKAKFDTVYAGALVVMGWYFLRCPVHREQTRIAMKALNDPEIIRLMLGNLPIWVVDSDFERVNWLNNAIEGLWPFVSTATGKAVKKALHPIFAKHKPSFISELVFSELHLAILAEWRGRRMIIIPGEDQDRR